MSDYRHACVCVHSDCIPSAWMSAEEILSTRKAYNALLELTLTLEDRLVLRQSLAIANGFMRVSTSQRRFGSVSLSLALMAMVALVVKGSLTLTSAVVCCLLGLRFRLMLCKLPLAFGGTAMASGVKGSLVPKDAQYRQRCPVPEW